MARYIDWSDVVDRYSMISDFEGSIEVDSTYISYAEADIESRLASKFSTPFSDNNITVKDLCIDATLYKALMFKDTKKSEIIGKSIDERIKMLLDGATVMMTNSGSSLYADIDTAWSETDGYTPTFGAGDETNFLVDSSRLYDEELARD